MRYVLTCMMRCFSASVLLRSASMRCISNHQGHP